MKIDHSLISVLVNTSENLNASVCLVGGSVRDYVLNRDVFDLDFVVEGVNAIDFVKKAFPNNKKRVHRRFMTVSVFLDRHGWVDFASAREESYKECGAMPDVRASVIEKDLFRRDFTVNAMAMGIGAGRFEEGQLIDLYNGMRAIKEKTLDVLHNKSFWDDPIRILRGVRLAIRLGFSFGDNTIELIKQARENNFLTKVPKERIRDELLLAFSEPDPAQVLLKEYELLSLDWISENIDVSNLHDVKGILDFFSLMERKEAVRVIDEFKFPKKLLKRL